MAKEIKLTKRLQRCFDYMMEFGSITSLQAFKDLGDTRLSATIFELKKRGVNISCETVKFKNRFGELRHVKKYWIG